MSSFSFFGFHFRIYSVSALLLSLPAPWDTIWDEHSEHGEDNEEPKYPKTANCNPLPQNSLICPRKGPSTMLMVLCPSWQVSSSQPSTPKHPSNGLWSSLTAPLHSLLTCRSSLLCNLLLKEDDSDVGYTKTPLPPPRFFLTFLNIFGIPRTLLLYVVFSALTFQINYYCFLYYFGFVKPEFHPHFIIWEISFPAPMSVRHSFSLWKTTLESEVLHLYQNV